MGERKTFLLRIEGEVLDAIRHWADDDLRSLNGQLEFVIRRALRDAGRWPRRDEMGSGAGDEHHPTG